MDQFLTDLFTNAQSLSKTLMFQKLVPVNFLLTVHVHAVMWKCITTTEMYVFRVGPEERLWKRTVRHVHWTRRMLWMVGGRWRKWIQDVWWSGIFRMAVSGWTFLLVPVQPSGPGQTVVKRLCVCVCVCVVLFDNKFYICCSACYRNFCFIQVYIYMNYLKVAMYIFQNLLRHHG